VSENRKMTKQRFITIIKKVYDFFDDDTFYFAASLSFFTIFSMLPILALIIAIMSSYDIFASQIQMLLFYVLDFVNPTHSQEVVASIESFLVNIDKLGTLGLFYLIFVFTMFFKDYENIVSKIHQTENRSFMAMSFLYISFIFIIPLALIIFTVTATFFDSIYTKTILDFIFGMIFMTTLFKISVNKHISLKAATLSAFLTLVILKITQVLFLYYIVYSSTYSTIYGTLSAMVFMFLWIYISWTIYLYGIKVCHKLNIEYSK
jgi:membrane protein